MSEEAKQKKKTKPTVEEARNRRLKVMQLHRSGLSAEAIARAMKVRKQAILDDIHTVKNEWKRRVSQDFDDIVAEELGELMMVRADALRAYETTKNTKGKPAGDPRFLELVRSVTNDIIKFMGLDDRQAYDMRKSIPQDDNTKTMEMVVSTREELDQLRDEHGNISLSIYMKRLQQLKQANELTVTPNAVAAR